MYAVRKTVIARSATPHRKGISYKPSQFYGPAFFDTDLALVKETQIRGWEGARLGVGALFFNLFNHPNFDGPNVDIGTPSNFGRITGTVTTPTSILGANLTGSTSPRLIQLTARITF